MSRRLVIDLDVCRDCDECPAECDYPFHYENRGVARLRELAAFELACRRCEERSCVNACPNDALEEQESGFLKRYNMLCTGCLSCAHACPFGNIIPAAFQFRDSKCDFCAGDLERTPACVTSCDKKALWVEDVAEGAEGLYLLGDNLAVRSHIWQKKEPVQPT